MRTLSAIFMMWTILQTINTDIKIVLESVYQHMAWLVKMQGKTVDIALCGLVELKIIWTGVLLFVYICIAVRDPII